MEREGVVIGYFGAILVFHVLEVGPLLGYDVHVLLHSIDLYLHWVHHCMSADTHHNRLRELFHSFVLLSLLL